MGIALCRAGQGRGRIAKRSRCGKTPDAIMPAGGEAIRACASALALLNVNGVLLSASGAVMVSPSGFEPETY